MKAPWKKENGNKVLERLERRLHEELLRLFNDSGSFYFMLRGDITNSMQCQYTGEHKEEFSKNVRDFLSKLYFFPLKLAGLPLGAMKGVRGFEHHLHFSFKNKQ